MLELVNITKIYSDRKGLVKKTALKNINLNFDETGLNMILGKSGSGKSSLLNIIGGLDDFNQGDIIINKRYLNKFNPNEIESYRNTYIGFIFQEYYMLEKLTVGENLELALLLQNTEKHLIKAKVKEILQKVDLENYHNHKINELSGGEKQRVVIARALIKDSKIILADEPTGNLDSETSKMILELLKSLAKDRLVIMVTHDRGFAEEYGDRIIELKDGEIINDYFNHPNNVIKQNETMEAKFNKTVLPLKYKFKFAFSSLLKYKFRLLCLTILFVSSLVFVLIALTFSFYDATKATALTFEKAKLNQVPIVKIDNGKKVSFTDQEIAELQKSNPDFDFLQTIKEYENVWRFASNENYIYDSTSFNKIVIVDDSQINVNLLTGHIPDKDNEIMMTDYMGSMFIKYDVISNVTTVEELIGKEVNYKDDMLTISGIIQTDYDSFELDYTSDEVPYMFSLKHENFYQELYMTKNTYEKVFNQSTRMAVMNEGYYNLPWINKTILGNKKIFGTYPQNDNEIMISIHDISEYFDKRINYTLLTDQEISSYLGKKITLDLSYYPKYNGKTSFSIAGIIDNRNDTIPYFVFNQNMFDYFNYHTSKNDGGKLKEVSAFIKNDDTGYYNLLKDLPNTYRHNTPYSKELYSVDKFTSHLNTVFFIVSLVFSLFSIIMIYTFISASIKAKQKEIGTLRAIGTRNSDILNIYIIESSFILFISLLITIILSRLSLYGLNNDIASYFDIRIEVLYFNIISIIITILIAVSIIMVSTIIPLKKIGRMKPIDAIKKI
jgi:ABC-type lipoprotein export system ATPase subunit